MPQRKCYLCGTDMEERTISTTAGWGKYKLTIEGINAYVCPKCGETVYSAQEMHMIQELSKSLANLQEKKRPDLLNVTEIADLLRVSTQTIYNMIKDGRLNAIKIGREWRFMRKDIQSILTSNSAYQTAARGLNGNISEHDTMIIEKKLRELNQ